MTRTSGVVVAYRVLVALLGLSAVVTEVATLVERGRFVPANFFSYFTIESNCVSVAVLLLSAFARYAGREGRRVALLRGANTVDMVLVGVAFSLLLSGLEDTEFTAVPWDNTVLHYVVPVAVALDWLVAVPQVRVPWARAQLWLAFPLLYLVYTLVRGPVVDWYPYPFLDPGQNAWSSIVLTCVVLLVAAAALAGALAWSTRRRDDRHVAHA